MKKSIKISGVGDKFNSFRKEFKQYYKAVFKLVSDAYKLDKKRFMAVILTSGGGVSLLGFSLGILLKYVKKLEKNEAIIFFKHEYAVRDGFVLAVVSISVLIFILLSAGMLLYSRLKVRDILVDYHLKALPIVASKFGWEPPSEVAWINDATLKANIKTLYMGDPKKSANALRRLFEGTQHFFISIGGIFALFYIDTVASVYLIIIILFSIIFFNKINQRAAQSTRSYEKMSVGTSRRSLALLNNVSSWPNPHYNPAILRDVTHQGLLLDTSKVYFDRFVTRSMTEFVSYALTGIALSFLMFTLGHAAIKGEKSWAEIVGYIVVLRMVMQALKTLFKIFTEVARIYPGLNRLYRFDKSKYPVQSEVKTDKLNIVLSNDAISEKNEKSINIRKGEVIALSAPISFSRFSVLFFEKVLSGRKFKKNKRGLLGSISIAVPLSPPMVPVTLREMLGLQADVGADDLRKALGIYARKIEKIFPLEPDIPISAECMEKVSIDFLRRLSLVSCIISDRPIILVESSLLTDKWLMENKTTLEKRIIIACFKGLPDEIMSKEVFIKSYIVTAADGAIVFSGSYDMLKKRRDSIEKVLKDHEERVIATSKSGIVLNESDEDDDDE